MKYTKKILLGLAVLLLPMTASAGLMCDTRYENNVIQNSGCELGSVNNDSTAAVNLDLMFGYDDWTQVWKNDSGDAMPAALTDFSLSTNELSGSFTINWGTPPTGDVMFVLKDGMDDPDTYVGWLLDAGDYGVENYAYNTPFLNTTTDQLKQISHAGFYYRDGGPTTRSCDPLVQVCSSQVPEPAPLFLMGAGLLALRHQVKRRQR